MCEDVYFVSEVHNTQSTAWYIWPSSEWMQGICVVKCRV